MPETIGRYRIETELGRGGMAVVYRAYDPRFKREVALKVLPREFLHAKQFLARFEREAQTIAALEHPAIVPVYDFGEEGGQPYLVMRYMPGGSLGRRARVRTFSLAEAARLLAHLAPALDYLHAEGIIHRDLKPENILFDQWDHPYLSDFGIVKLAMESNAPLTATGGLMGTPAYMSPEQVRGDVALDGRSDIYALGVILYQMLAGDVPYRATTPISQAFKHVNEPVPNILDARADLPPSVQDVIAQALAKERDDRFATASALANAVAGVAGEPTLVEGPPASTVPARAPTEHQSSTLKRRVPAWGWLLGGVAALGLLVAFVFLFGLLRDEGPSPAGGQEAATGAVIALETTDSPTLPPTVLPSATSTPPATATPAPTASSTPAPATTATVDVGAPPLASEPGERWTRPADGMVMVSVPAGSFPRGSASDDARADGDETPRRLLSMSAFWLDRTEVTNSQFRAFVAATGYQTDAERTGEGWIAVDDVWDTVAGADWQHPQGPASDLQGLADHPVVLVSYFDAAAYCVWAGARLPTEAQWEYAARGPDAPVYPWGDAFDPGRLNYCDGSCTTFADSDPAGNDGYPVTAPVGSFPQGASWVGAQDMAGNVWEWVRDWYQGDYYAAALAADPPGPAAGTERVIRGGGWNNGTRRFLRSAFRDHEPPALSYFTVGFRCVLPAP